MNAILTAHDACNPMISRDSVGRAKDTYYTLPNKEFSYGKPNIKDPLNARILTSSWQEHVASKEKVDSNCVNFLAINRFGPGRCSISPKAVTEMVAKLKAKRQSTPAVALKSEPVRDNPVVVSASGKASSPPVCISEVIENKFGNQGHVECTGRYEAYLSERVERTKIKTIVRETKASRGHQVDTSASVPKEPFKLTKFKNVPSVLHKLLHVATTN